MRILADESCDFAVVRALRAAGHNVVAIAEVSPREGDGSVIERALREERIVKCLKGSSLSFNQVGCGLVDFLEMMLWTPSIK